MIFNPNVENSQTETKSAAMVLREMLESSEYTQREVALGIGISPSSAGCIISNALTGRIRIPVRWLGPISKFLGRDVRPLVVAHLKEREPELLRLMKECELIVDDI